MNHKIIFSIAGSLLLSLLTLVGCTADIDSPTPPEANGDQDTFLKLEINVADTRADLDATTFAEGDSIFVAVVDSENPNLYRTSKAVYDGQTWALETPVNLAAVYEDGTKWSDNVKILAFYPYGLGENYDNEKQGCYHWSYNGVDQSKMMLMYGNMSGINKSNTTAKISFHHAMSRITLDIKNSTQETIRVSHIFVSDNHKSASNRYLLFPTFLSAYSGLQDYYENSDMLGVGDEFLINPQDEKAVDILLYPTEISYEKFESENINGGLTFSLVTHNGSALEAKDIYFDLEAPLWRPGQQYTYPVTLSTGSNNQVVADGEINGHEYVDLGLSVLWATCNIGAETPEDYGLYFQWGDVVGHVREGDAIADGYVFDDSWYVGKLTLNQKLEQGIIEYDKVYNGKDLYKLTPEYDAATQNWGDGWRMPTYDEIMELLGFKLLFTTASNTFELKSVKEGFENKSITIPHAQSFYQNGLSNSVQTYLWSKTTGELDDAGRNTIDLSLNKNDNRIGCGSAKDLHYYGYTIRPVADRPTK